MRHLPRLLGTTLFFSAPLVLSFACSSTPEVRDDSDSGNDAGSDLGNGGVGSGDDVGIGPDGDSDGTGSGARPGNGKPEVCDGVDNNDDGLVDNIDAGNDGVCDCIKIATIGIPGIHGNRDGKPGTNVFKSWLDGKSTAGVVDLALEELTAEKIASFDVIVAQDLRKGEYSEAEINVLHDWMKEGGGLMTMIGYGSPSERSNINAFLQPVGLSYGEDQILQKDGTFTVPVNDMWNATHPIANGIKAIGIDNGYPVDGDGIVIAEEGDFVTGQAKQVDKGRVFVWGDEWISYDSEWEQADASPVKYEVERFWLNSIKWLGPQDSCQVSIPTTIR